MLLLRAPQRALGKAAVLIALLAGTLYLVWGTPVAAYLTPEAATALLRDAGGWAPVSFILAFGVGVCLFVPAILFYTVGALYFGSVWGFVYIWLGAMFGAGLNFILARVLGRDLVAALLRGKLKSWDQAIARNGFTTVLTLRLLYAPFTPTNLSMGLSRVRFRDYLAATGLGIVVGALLFVALVDQLKAAWMSGDWSLLWSARTLAGSALFALSLLLPWRIRRRSETNRQRPPVAPALHTAAERISHDS